VRSGFRRRIFKLALLTTALILVYRLYSSSPYEHLVASNLWGLNQLHYFKFRKKLNARLIRKVDTRSAPSPNEPSLSVPGADVEAGYYDHAVQVRLTHNASSDIRYTLDGSIPTSRSPKYLQPITHRQDVRPPLQGIPAAAPPRRGSDAHLLHRPQPVFGGHVTRY
jgi:hypothetical protein